MPGEVCRLSRMSRESCRPRARGPSQTQRVQFAPSTERRVRRRAKARSLGHLAAHGRGRCRPTSQEWVPGEYRWLHEG
jgi:hypothetical protein